MSEVKFHVRVAPWLPNVIKVYRQIDAEAAFDPFEPWWGDHGRFRVDDKKTLYAAESPRGATAEFLRRHSELIEFQGDFVVKLFELSLEISTTLVDVRGSREQNEVGIARGRLVSSESDEGERYLECRALSAAASAAGMGGVAYPSAAALWADAWNLVLFGEHGEGWSCVAYGEVDRPYLARQDVAVLD